MSEVKWIRIVTDIFDDEKMYAIECMPDGRDLELVWFKILCLAGKCNQNGFLTINNKIAYTDEMLSKIFRMDIGVVQRALDIFQTLEMIEVVDDTYMVSNWMMYQSGDRMEELKESHRQAQKRYREKQKQKKLAMGDITGDITNDITSSIYISDSYISDSKDTTLVKHKYGQYKNVPLDDIQMEKLKNEFPDDWEDRIEEVSIYCQCHGKKYKDYLATIRSWARSEKKKEQKKEGWDNVKV